MKKPSSVCVVGSTNIDIVCQVSRFPQPGETIAGLSSFTSFGGKGGNQAVMAAKQGANVSLIGKIGNDSFGEDCLRNYRSQNVQTEFLFRSEKSTGTASILVNDQGENCIVVVGGANAELTAKDVEKAHKPLSEALVVIGQLEVPVESTAAAFRMARESKAVTIFNPAPVKVLPADFLCLVDMLVLNETEAELLAPNQKDLKSKAFYLQSLGPQKILITLGEKGVLVLDQNEFFEVAGEKVVCVDSTGAGDAFVGTLGAQLASGKNLKESAQAANKMAALTVTKAGAQSSFPQI